VPTTTAAPFNADKGKSLSTFINYFLCAGQQKAQILGYSPLPKNLVQAGFAQVAKIPGATASPSLATCNNPAFGLLTSAPQPLACQSKTATVSCDGTAAATPTPATTTTAPPAAVTTSPGTTSTPTAVAPTQTQTQAPTTSKTPTAAGQVKPTVSVAAPASPAASPGSTVSPASPSPAVVAPAGGGGTAPPAAAPTQLVDQAGAPYVTSVQLAAHSDNDQSRTLYWVSALVLVGVVVAPPVISRRMKPRRKSP
jgi:phosphate transport system substrate-binding protein